MKFTKLIFALTTAAALLFTPCAAGQNANKVHRVGFINVGPAAPNTSNVDAFRAGLRDLGYVEGRDIIIDYRWADGKVDRLPGMLNELISLKPDVIISTGGPQTIQAVKAATSTLPVVFITGDPVAEGIVPSLARPGGNLTGFAVLATDLEPKRLELLKQVVSKATRIAVVWNPAQRHSDRALKDIEVAAKVLGLTTRTWEARDARELDQALAAIAAARVDALVVLADPVLGYERTRIVEFATRESLPGIYFWREFAEAGGLMSYGTDLPTMYRHAATYVDKILKGAKPGDLPIEQPTTFELVINVKTAKALGLSIPQTLLLRANEVIQ